jgi:hypothetical protein
VTRPETVRDTSRYDDMRTRAGELTANHQNGVAVAVSGSGRNSDGTCPIDRELFLATVHGDQMVVAGEPHC